MVKATNMSK